MRTAKDQESLCIHAVLQKAMLFTHVSGRPIIYVEVLLPSQSNGVMLSMVSLPNNTFTGQT